MESNNVTFSPRLVVALAIYLTSLFAANTLGIKLMPFLFGTHLSVAVFSFPFVFLMTDVVGEVYGKKIARLFVLAGFVSIVAWLAYSFISLPLPWGERSTVAPEAYNMIFNQSIRFAIASMIAFGIAEYQDVLSFFFFRRKLGVKNFWLRSNLSNLWSQLLDTSIFMVIAFAFVLPAKVIVGIIIPWWLYKVAMGALYTPLSYIGIRLLKGKDHAS